MTSEPDQRTSPDAALAAALDARFFAPLRRPRTRRAGVELELPVYCLEPGAPTDFAAVHAATADFLARFPFPETARDDAGALYRARRPPVRRFLATPRTFARMSAP